VNEHAPNRSDVLAATARTPYVAILLYIVAYIVLDRISYIAPVRPFNITAWTPQPGLSIAFLVLFGLRYWPCLIVSAILAEFLVRASPSPVHYEVVNAFVLAAGYTSIAYMLKRRLKGRAYLGTLRDLSWFAAFTITFTLPVAASYVAVLTFARMLPASDFVFNATLFWMGDVIGVIITTPVLLIAWRFFKGDLRRVEITRELILQALVLGGVVWIVFGLPDTDEFKVFYPLFIPLIWIAVRNGFVGATIAITFIQLALIIWAYVLDEQAVTVLELQGLMLTLALTGQFLGMAITEWREAQQNLRDREEDLQEALRLASASEMYTAIAHELNQPLAATSHYAWASRKIADQKGVTNTDLLEALDNTLAEAHRAGAVTQRLRDLYLGGAVRKECVSLEALVKTALASLTPRFSRYAIKFRHALPDPPLMISVDPVQITAVVHNLVSNAIEALTIDHAMHREIALTAKVEGDVLTMSVEDSGSGIPDEMLERVFMPFVTDKAKGLGLGLAICRTILKAHGSDIWVEKSRLGGARFCFTLLLKDNQSG